MPRFSAAMAELAAARDWLTVFQLPPYETTFVTEPDALEGLRVTVSRPPRWTRFPVDRRPAVQDPRPGGGHAVRAVLRGPGGPRPLPWATQDALRRFPVALIIWRPVALGRRLPANGP
jgi:hypothetical protein